MLKNMVVHELALAVTYYGVSAAGLAAVEVDPTFSLCQTRGARPPRTSATRTPRDRAG